MSSLTATWTTAAYNPPAVPSGVPHHLRAQTADHVDNWSEWTTLFSLQFDGEPPLISDTIPANGSVITSAWPVISATLTDPSTSLRTGPEPGSGVQPLSTTLIIDSEVVTPQALNRYVYANSNPLRYNHPPGHQCAGSHHAIPDRQNWSVSVGRGYQSGDRIKN
jgi:hypothetical protein